MLIVHAVSLLLVFLHPPRRARKMHLRSDMNHMMLSHRDTTDQMPCRLQLQVLFPARV